MPPTPISVVEPGAQTNERLAFGARITSDKRQGEGTIEEFPNGEQPPERRIVEPISSIGIGEVSDRIRVAAEPVDAHRHASEIPCRRTGSREIEVDHHRSLCRHDDIQGSPCKEALPSRAPPRPRDAPRSPSWHRPVQHTS